MMQKILDMTCGGKMMWWDKNDHRILAMDCRAEEHTLCDGRKFSVLPDLIGDFRKLPHPDETFSVVLFDPPHLVNAGKNGWQFKKYGRLHATNFGSDILRGLEEGLRVLRPGGVMVFKWCTEQIPLAQISPLFPIKPILHNRVNKTHIILFVKP